MNESNTIYYLSNIIKEINTDKILSVILTDSVTKKKSKHLVDKEFMEFSLKNEIKIKNDEKAKILVYTTKSEKGEFGYTVKAFYSGNQTNLLHNDLYVKGL